MEVIRETLWKRCLSTPTKPPAKNSNICLSETAYQHKGTRKKCKKTNHAAIIQWQRQCLMDRPHPKPWPKSKTGLSRVPVHCITPFCSDAFVSPPNLYPPWWEHSPPANVARVQIPASTPYVGWVCCWFSPLLRGIFQTIVFPSPQKLTLANSNSTR